MSAAPLPQLPLPPDHLMMAVSGHANHDDFARSRLAGPPQMLRDLQAAHFDPATIHDVLDFGCGCGRFLAGWVMLGTPFRLQGCDYNPLLVDWCNENIPGVPVAANALGEPLPYEAGSFDLIYLISVFTHLSRDEQKRLATEFFRLLRPGGGVYLTFHGEYYYPTMLSQLPDGAELFDRTGFLINSDTPEGSNDCWTLHRPDALLAIFEGFVPAIHFRSVERGPTDVGAWQDSLILRKP